MTTSSKPTVNFDTIPIFEVRKPSTGESIKIYADGRIENFPDGFSLIINRIPLYTSETK